MATKVSADVSVKDRMQAMALLSKEERETPAIAWPTVLLFISALAAYWVTSYLFWTGKVHSIEAVILTNAVAIFVLFTPMHDCSHGSVGKGRFSCLNSIIGRVCSFHFAAPFLAFRYVHLEHHKHTNDPVKDPDYWSARTPAHLRPLRWFSQELHYYVPYLRHLFGEDKHWRKRPAEAVEVIAELAAIIYTIYALVGMGYGKELVLTWVVPQKIAVLFLAWTFDFIPHKPHRVLSKDDIYASTSKVEGPRDLTWPLLYQNYHNIHHLYPFFPFYQYRAIWQAHEKVLRQRGTPVVQLSKAANPFTLTLD